MIEGPIEFGIFDILQVDPTRPTAETLQERLSHHREADQLGLDYIFVAERHFMRHYRATSPGLLLSNLAATTTNARLGVLAYTIVLHHPILLAEEISTLDHLSNGRLEVGIGLGHRPVEIEGLGYPAEHRQAIFLEDLSILVRAWSGEQFDFDGALYHLKDVQVDPPLQEPHPPMWYAGGDPQITAWAARNGLSLAVGFRPDPDLVESVEAYRSETAPEAAPRQRIALMRSIYLAESDEQAREEVISDLMAINEELAATAGDVLEAPQPAPTRAYAERQYADQKAKQIVISGSPESVANEIAQSMSTLHANTFLASVHLMGVEDERVRRALRLFAMEVAPRVREILDSSAS